jgi:hypothetical protein
LSGVIARQLVLDIAAPLLPSDQMLRRIVPTAERTVTRGGDKKIIDKGDAIRERRPLIKGYFAALRLIVGAVMSSAC